MYVRRGRGLNYTTGVNSCSMCSYGANMYSVNMHMADVHERDVQSNFMRHCRPREGRCEALHTPKVSPFPHSTVHHSEYLAFVWCLQEWFLVGPWQCQRRRRLEGLSHKV